MINFKLANFDTVTPVGQEPDLYISWFWLTAGDLWLKFGDQVIYEYSQEAMDYFGNKPTPYNDYFIVRFLEDFTELFEHISESIPLHLYKLTEDIDSFRTRADKWLDIYDTDENEHNDFYYNEYNTLISWTYNRQLDSGHLRGGPHLSFYRHQDKIRIVWDTEHTLENGIRLWMAKDGNLEMNYIDFINEVKSFGLEFFSEMQKHVKLAIDKDWGDVKIDKDRLAEEHEERIMEFYNGLAFLHQKETAITDWSKITTLMKKMNDDLT